MNKLRSFLLFLCLSPCLLAVEVLHEWEGKGTIEKNVFELKIILFQNNQFIALAQTEEAPFAVEGTWASKDKRVYELTVTTEKIKDWGEVPIRKGKIYHLDQDLAYLLADGLGIELTGDDNHLLDATESAEAVDAEVKDATEAVETEVEHIIHGAGSSHGHD